MAGLKDVAAKLDRDKIRADFPILNRMVNGKPLAYLDNASTTQKPQQVIDTISDYYAHMNANVHRGVHTLSYESSIEYENAHKKVASFINAKSWREIVFTRNATEAMNLVAFGWGLWNLEPGDEIVISIMEHHAGIVPWFLLRERNKAVIKFVDVDEDGRLDMEKYKQAITPKTKIVGIIHTSNVLGTINPIKEMVAIAKEAGAITVVDAAQGVPHLAVDVQDLDCDFLAAAGHKMLGPSGTGFLYGKRDLLEKTEPFMRGGAMISTVTTEEATWNELPWKFEAGTPSIADGIALGTAVDYLTELGMDKVYQHEIELCGLALEKLLSLQGITVFGPHDIENRMGVISFNADGVHPHDLAGVLDEEGIAVRSGHHCAQPLMKRLGMDHTVRASFYLYNTKDDIDRLIAGVEKAIKIYKK
jgi:cysteine desulfurase/selenocysteine lyase